MLLHSAEAASLLPSPALLGALGLVAGGLLGGVVALLLGARRGTIQTVKEMHQLYPNASVVDRLDLETVITLESENASVVYIAAVGQDPHELEPVADVVRTQFLANGRAVDGYDQHHNVKVAERAGSLQVITTTLSDTVLRRVERDSSSLLIVPVRAKVTRMEQLDTFASATERPHLPVGAVGDPGLGLTYAQDHQRSRSLDRGSVRRQLPGAAAVDPLPLHPDHHAADVRLDGARPLGPGGRGQRSSAAALAAGDVGEWVVGDLAGPVRQPAVRQRQQLGLLGGHLAAAGPAAETSRQPGPTVERSGASATSVSGWVPCPLLFTLTQLVGIGYRDWVGQIVPAPFLVNGYVISYPIVYGSELYKSNAWITLEPSFLSFMLGVCVVAAILARLHWVKVMVIFAGLLCTTAGSGLAIVVAFAVLTVVSGRARRLRSYAVPGIVLGALFATTLLGEAITGRLTEVGNSQLLDVAADDRAISLPVAAVDCGHARPADRTGPGIVGLGDQQSGHPGPAGAEPGRRCCSTTAWWAASC